MQKPSNATRREAAVRLARRAVQASTATHAMTGVPATAGRSFDLRYVPRAFRRAMLPQDRLPLGYLVR